MIDKTMGLILGELNSFLGILFPSSEPHAVLSGLTNQDGTAAAGTENRIVLSLMNIERETAAVSSTTRSGTGPLTRSQPPLNLNLYLMVSASFGTNYLEAVKFLSSAMSFFQDRAVITPQNAQGPGFPKGLERLTIELVNLKFQDLQSLWASLGAKYVPSVLYKVRMLTMQDGWVIERVPSISGTDNRT
jgi:hypothetical protein